MRSELQFAIRKSKNLNYMCFKQIFHKSTRSGVSYAIPDKKKGENPMGAQYQNVPPLSNLQLSESRLIKHASSQILNCIQLQRGQ